MWKDRTGYDYLLPAITQHVSNCQAIILFVIEGKLAEYLAGCVVDEDHAAAGVGHDDLVFPISIDVPDGKTVPCLEIG